MASRNPEPRERVIRGSGNVFADLGFADGAERQAKLRLAYALNQVVEARQLSGRCCQGARRDATEGLRTPSLQTGGVFRRTFNESVDGARPGCRDRDSAKTPLAESCPNQRRRSLRVPMALKPTATTRRRRSFTAARRRALARLRKGLDLQWTPPASRDALHDRGQGSRRHDR